MTRLASYLNIPFHVLGLLQWMVSLDVLAFDRHTTVIVIFVRQSITAVIENDPKRNIYQWLQTQLTYQPYKKKWGLCILDQQKGSQLFSWGPINDQSDLSRAVNAIKLTIVLWIIKSPAHQYECFDRFINVLPIWWYIVSDGGNAIRLIVSLERCVAQT